MPKISTYEIVVPEGGDKIIITKTDGNPEKATKNITIESLVAYIISQGGGANADGYISSVALNGTDLDFTGVLSGFTGTVDLSSISNTGSAERVELEVRFDEAVAKGDPVYVTGFNLGQNRITVAKADAADSAKMPSIGLAGDSYLLNDNGVAITMGSLVDVNTASFSEGDVLYVDSGGGLTANKPGGEKLIQNVGKVGRSQSVNGEIVVMAIGRTNDVPNLPNGKFFIGSSNNTVESAYTLPTTDGTANQVLQTDGSGTVTFETITSDETLSVTSTQSGSDFDLVNAHVGGLNKVTGSTDITVTVQTNANENIAVGSVVVFRQYGSGTLTAIGDVGVTLTSRQTYKEGDTLTLWQESTDNWVVINPPASIHSRLDGEPTGAYLLGNIVGISQADYDAGSPVSTTTYIIE